MTESTAMVVNPCPVCGGELTHGDHSAAAHARYGLAAADGYHALTPKPEAASVTAWHDAAWMQTYTGRQFRPFTAAVEDIDPEDIAHALSQICRYGGHTKRFYSVAEHCVLLAEHVLQDASLPITERDDRALWCLLHDAAEAYIGDMVRPLKITPAFSAYRDLDDALTEVISVRFGAPGIRIPPAVKELDARILLDEREQVLSTPPTDWDQDIEGIQPLGVTLHCWSPLEAEAEYLRLLTELI